METTKYFIDERNPDIVLHISVLQSEYDNFVGNGEIDPQEKSFYDYVNMCLACNGGTLKEINI